MGHATDAWASARIMSARPVWGASIMGATWLNFHILESYRFTRNKAILKKHWNALTASVQFLVSSLVEGPEKGMFMSPPAGSPENSFIYKDKKGAKKIACISAGNTYDQFIIMQAFSDYIYAAKVLDQENKRLVQKVKAILPNLYRPKISSSGRLLEWRFDFEEKEPAHRHISHVLGGLSGQSN